MACIGCVPFGPPKREFRAHCNLRLRGADLQVTSHSDRFQSTEFEPLQRTDDRTGPAVATGGCQVVTRRSAASEHVPVPVTVTEPRLRAAAEA